MQRKKEGQDDFFHLGDPFGNVRSMIPSLFGGRNPFDDPFFTHPFGSMFESTILGPSAAASGTQQTGAAKGIVIEELNSDNEGQNEEDEGIANDNYHRQKYSGSSNEPSVEHPDDDADEKKSKSVTSVNDHNKVEGARSQGSSFGVQTCRVTYGGVDGAYYTSTRTTRTGTDGVMLEETKEADRTTGQGTHRISRGIHDKGHSVTRKLNSDGKVDTLQTLHNLNEDELAGFEEAWKGNVKGHLPGWEDGFDIHGSSSSKQKEKATQGGWALQSLEHPRKSGGTGPDNAARSNSSAGRTKKVVRINIE